MSFRTLCASRLSGEVVLLEDPVAQFTDCLLYTSDAADDGRSVDLGGSDHFPIILKTSPNEDEPAAEHWRLDRADWMSFRTRIAIV